MAENIEGTPISKGGTTIEKDNNRVNKAGLYRHPENGSEMVTLHHPLFGDAQSDAAIRVGFVRVDNAPAPKTEEERIDMPSAPTPKSKSKVVKDTEDEAPEVEPAVVSPDIQEKIKADAQDRAAKQVKNN